MPIQQPVQSIDQPVLGQLGLHGGKDRTDPRVRHECADQGGRIQQARCPAPPEIRQELPQACAQGRRVELTWPLQLQHLRARLGVGQERGPGSVRWQHEVRPGQQAGMQGNHTPGTPQAQPGNGCPLEREPMHRTEEDGGQLVDPAPPCHSHTPGVSLNTGGTCPEDRRKREGPGHNAQLCRTPSAWSQQRRPNPGPGGRTCEPQHVGKHGVAVDVCLAVPWAAVRQRIQHAADAGREVDRDCAAGTAGACRQDLGCCRPARHLHASGDHAVQQLVRLGPRDELQHG